MDSQLDIEILLKFRLLEDSSIILPPWLVDVLLKVIVFEKSTLSVY